MIKHGKHKGKTLEFVIKTDPNYALYAHANYNWFPKLSDCQIEDCRKRYKHPPKQGRLDLRSGLYLRDWSTYDMADYGDGWM